MRELKYRGWDGKEWVYFDLSVIGGLMPITNVGDGRFFMYDFYGRSVIFNSLNQYTGFKDRIGREIYEEDILQSWTLSYNENTGKHDIPCQSFYEGVVEFGKKSFSSYAQGASNVETMTGWIVRNNTFTNPLTNGYEIIGNKVQTPELIK